MTGSMRAVDIWTKAPSILTLSPISWVVLPRKSLGAGAEHFSASSRCWLVNGADNQTVSREVAYGAFSRYRSDRLGKISYLEVKLPGLELLAQRKTE